MRTTSFVLPVIAVVMAAPVAAQSPIQVALFTPIQIVKQDRPVRGLRLDIIYGSNSSVRGVDIGLVNRSTGIEASNGLQFGVVSIVQGQFTGWQANAVSINRGSFKGLQTGIIAVAEQSEGLQFAGINKSANHRGLQIGIINYAQRTDGIQLGLINIIRLGGQFPAFPIINWGRGL